MARAPGQRHGRGQPSYVIYAESATLPASSASRCRRGCSGRRWRQWRGRASLGAATSGGRGGNGAEFSAACGSRAAAHRACRNEPCSGWRRHGRRRWRCGRHDGHLPGPSACSNCSATPARQRRPSARARSARPAAAAARSPAARPRAWGNGPRGDGTGSARGAVIGSFWYAIPGGAAGGERRRRWRWRWRWLRHWHRLLRRWWRRRRRGRMPRAERRWQGAEAAGAGAFVADSTLTATTATSCAPNGGAKAAATRPRPVRWRLATASRSSRARAARGPGGHGGHGGGGGAGGVSFGFFAALDRHAVVRFAGAGGLEAVARTRRRHPPPIATATTARAASRGVGRVLSCAAASGC